MPSVGERIKEVREKKGLTQEKLAEKTGLSKGFISDVENGKTDISSDNLLKVADVLNANLDYLLRGETREVRPREPVVIPPELSQFAEEEGLGYAQTLVLLEAHESIVARRSNKLPKEFSIEDWKQLYRALQRYIGTR